MQITKNVVAQIDYTLKNDEGQVLDTSEGRGPLSYLHGAGNIVPGLEKALEGKTVGDELSVRIECEEAYGPRHEELVQSVPRAQLPPEPVPEVGMQFQGENEQGMLIMTVVNVGEEEVTLDANHPLAGVTLNFAVEVVEVREPSEEELKHGHVHGPGGHEH